MSFEDLKPLIEEGNRTITATAQKAAVLEARIAAIKPWATAPVWPVRPVAKPRLL